MCFLIPSVNICRICVEEQVLPVAASLPPGYLAIQPLGLGKGVSNDAEPAHEGKGTHVSVCLLQQNYLFSAIPLYLVCYNQILDYTSLYFSLTT